MTTVAVVGDVMLREPVGRRSSALCRELAERGIVVGNLEMALSRRGTPAEKLITIRGGPEVGDELSRLGFAAMTLANNHILDFGYDAMYDTREVLERNGVATCGVGTDVEEALRGRVVGAETESVVVIGVCAALPNGFAADAARPGVAPVRVVSRIVLDPATLAETPGMSPYVETTAVTADVRAVCAEVMRWRRHGTRPVIVTIHWGVPPGWAAETQGDLAAYQRSVAHELVDAGADAIVGHHPHAIQRMEVYRDKPILYSVGNFVFQLFDPQVSHPQGLYPEYALETLQGERNRFGAVALLTFAESGTVGTELRIVRLDARGEPAWANVKETRRCMQWLSPPDTSTPGLLRLSTTEGRPVLVATTEPTQEAP